MNELTGVSQDSRNIATLTWIGCLFFGFIPPLIVYLIKKDDAYAQEQAKESLNWSITAILGYVLGGILTVILIGGLLMIVVGLAHVVFCIMGAIAASGGKGFRVPWQIRLIK